MALRETWRELKRGNIREGINYLFVPQSEVDRGRNLDSRLEALVKQRAIENKITPEQAQATLARMAPNTFRPGGIMSQPGTDIVGGFVEGLKEGANNIQRSVRSGLGGLVNFSFGSIPWQLWLIAGVYVAWRLGWWKYLKR